MTKHESLMHLLWDSKILHTGTQWRKAIREGKLKVNGKVITENLSVETGDVIEMEPFMLFHDNKTLKMTVK